MNSDVISTIRDVEGKAGEQYSAELEKSKEAIRDAKVESKTAADQSVLTYKEQCQKRLDDAADSAKQTAQALLGQNELQCKALRDVADQNMQKSVDYILGRIVG